MAAACDIKKSGNPRVITTAGGEYIIYDLAFDVINRSKDILIYEQGPTQGKQLISLYSSGE